MGPSDNLIIGEVSSSCSANIAALNRQNSILDSMACALNVMSSDSTIAGAGYEAAGAVSGDLCEAMALMRAVNDLDIMDFQSLMSGIGGEDLIGEVIIGKMKEAEAKEKEYEAQAAAYAAMAASAPPELAGFYSAMASMYSQMARIQHTIFEYWEGKSNNYDTIEATTASLFTQTQALRGTVNSAIEGLRGALVLGEGVSAEEAKWRKTLDESLKQVQELLTKNESANAAIASLKGALDTFISSADPVNLSTGNFYYD